MVTTIEKALYYSATARRALREARKQKLHYRYPECIIRTQEGIEFAGKSMLEFMDVEYKREHYIGAELERIGQKTPYLKEKVAKAMVISDRWLQQSRNLTRYGFQNLGLPPKIAFSERDANYALSDTEEMLTLLDTIERSIKLCFPIKIAILNGHVSEDRGNEVQCNESPSTSISSAEWHEHLGRLQTDDGNAKYDVEFISASQISNRYSAVINPFGEVYPEIDIKKKVIFSIIEDYIFTGGIFVCAGGFPLFYGWDVKNKGEKIPLVEGEVYLPSKIGLYGDAVYVEEMKKLLPFRGTLLWKEFHAQTTGDTDKHSGPYPLDVTQTEEDINKFGVLTDIGGEKKVSEFRALTEKTKECIPLIRGNRPEFGEVYLIAAISHGSGYLHTHGMDIAGESERQKTLASVDRFIEWLQKRYIQNKTK